MSAPGSLLWFAHHETRLAWRETLAVMTAGRPERVRKLVFGVAVFAFLFHLLAYFAVGSASGLVVERDLTTLIVVTAGLVLSGSAILAQAMESVTRVFYSRSDHELILSSPARADRLFAVRLGTIALSVSTMSLLITGPFINVLAWQGGPQWLGAYGVIIAVSLVATAIAVVLTATLFQAIGPKRTRFAAQITAALIGGLFVIGLQVAAMFSTGTISRIAFLLSEPVMASAPGLDSMLWWPARGALGDAPAMIAVVALSVLIFAAVTALYAPRFASFAVAALGTSQSTASKRGATRPFRVEASLSALRRKERLLLIRDPWLISQSLMQLLYLLPAALLLWRSYGADDSVALILVPVLAMAAGQLAGGLAWLTISGEDAPDLVLTAPIAESGLLRAKIEAVTQCIAIVFCPFVLALAVLSFNLALIAAGVIAASAASATAIQFWFRSQAKRSHFRRRHTSSRIATFSEAFSSIAWAGTGAMAVSGSWLALVPLVIALVILAAARALSPARGRA